MCNVLQLTLNHYEVASLIQHKSFWNCFLEFFLFVFYVSSPSRRFSIISLSHLRLQLLYHTTLLDVLVRVLPHSIIQLEQNILLVFLAEAKLITFPLYSTNLLRGSPVPRRRCFQMPFFQFHL